MKPYIAIPMGDPAGIGPEIVARAIADEAVLQAANCVVVGEKSVMENAVRITGADVRIHIIQQPDEGDYTKGVLNLIQVDGITSGEFRIGAIDGRCGKASFSYIQKAIQLANSGQADAVATTPINKESLKAGNIPFIGHTEIFGELTGTKDPLTLFQVRNLRVFFLSRHVSLREACDMVKKERIVDYVKRCQKALDQLGVSQGVMAVAGLNPHSGEHGLFGREEVEEVIPAVAQLQKEGYRVEGPIGADSVFHLALQGRYNSVLSLYHDQGHIATKTLDFEKTISITCGMPILRTSVDHGTAFDIAGTGKASAVSMVEAILLAAQYAPHFQKKGTES
ncbi:MAG: 4-hydroxythreonine-4-phosphate dehydrogenase PdxA [Christensenellales bacterium]